MYVPSRRSITICDIRLADPGDSNTGTSVLGVGMPLVIGIGFALVGVVIMFAWWAFGNRAFFKRPGLEAVPAEIADGRATTAELPPLYSSRRRGEATE